MPPSPWEGLAKRAEGEVDDVIVQFGSPSPAYGRPSPREGDLLGKTFANELDDLPGRWSNNCLATDIANLEAIAKRSVACQSCYHRHRVGGEP